MVAESPQSPTTSPGRQPPDYSQGTELLTRMLRIRLFEDAIKDLFTRNLVRGSTHLCQGQEATAVGACSVLVNGDVMTCTYRGHGAVLAMGAPLDRSFAEILGRQNGLCGAKGGSMHLTDFSVGAIGSNAIVGGQIPIAVGAGLAAQQLGTGGVALTFLGDGATNIGSFHESLNLAAVWNLPVIFLIENNHYGEYSPQALTTPIRRLADRAASYGIPGVDVDGNDVFAVREVVGAAAERARNGAGPTLIEADTYRQSGHSRADPATYRPPGELEHWLERDPIRRLEASLQQSATATVQELSQLRSRAESEVTAALERALSWPAPDPRDRLRDVYV